MGESGEMYTDMDTLDNKRREKDILLDIICGSDDLLNSVCTKFVSKLRESRPALSSRVNAMLDAALKADDRVAKHGLILFALNTESWAVDILSEFGRVNPTKYGSFRKADLKASTDQLLNGAHTSLRSYVEDTRLLYMIT